MFVESGCISTNIELQYNKYIYIVFERSSFCLSTGINFTSLALSSDNIYSNKKVTSDFHGTVSLDPV